MFCSEKPEVVDLRESKKQNYLVISINLPTTYQECRSLIGCAIHYLDFVIDSEGASSMQL